MHCCVNFFRDDYDSFDLSSAVMIGEVHAQISLKFYAIISQDMAFLFCMIISFYCHYQLTFPLPMSPLYHQIIL